MRVGKYRRVSTDMQKEEGISLHTQDERLNSFAHSQGWFVVDDYADEGYSAKDMNRPALQRLIEDMKQRKIDVLLVYRLDRLVRSVADLHELLKIMDQYDVKFKSCTEVFDTTNATGRLFITIIATLAQWERETIAERVFDNMLERSELGLRNGGPAPFGYAYNDDKELVQVQEEIKWVPFIFNKYKTTGSQNIAKILNKRGIKTKNGELWSDFAVRYILRNPIYSGYVRWNRRSFAKKKFTGEDVIKKYQQASFQPIITKQEWDETQELMKRRSQMAFRTDNYYPFSGIAKCAKCGQNYSGASKLRKKGGAHRYYKCAGRFRLGICDAPVIGEEAIETALLECLDLPDFDLEYQDEKKIDREQLEKELSRIDGRINRLKELYIEGDIDKKKYKESIERMNEEKAVIISILESEEEEVTKEELSIFIKNLKTTWHDLPHETKKAMISSLFSSLTVELVKPAKTGRYPEPAVVKITEHEFA
ncbi:recombinase family protein [Paenibacillus apiarius]|uniref:recombinase family protein n=1 Tax=Paenibacillus apiarius TaxID=46240 RepID=UPI003B3BE23A